MPRRMYGLQVETQCIASASPLWLLSYAPTIWSPRGCRGPVGTRPTCLRTAMLVDGASTCTQRQGLARRSCDTCVTRKSRNTWRGVNEEDSIARGLTGRQLSSHRVQFHGWIHPCQQHRVEATLESRHLSNSTPCSNTVLLCVLRT
jgi:hypothetical protein